MTDARRAEWVTRRLKPWDPSGARLESFAPKGFEAYARVFHPAGFRPGQRNMIDARAGRTWADLARGRGVQLTPEVAFVEVAGVEPGDQLALDEIAPMDGNLPPETCDALVRLLRPHTSTAEVAWFCLWEGNGAFWSTAHTPTYPDEATEDEISRYWEDARAQDSLLKATPRVETHARSYFLFRGPLEAVCTFAPSGWHASPNLWWPEDRAWIVVTEVDGYSTYVGGTRLAIDNLIAAVDIEAIEVSLDTHMDPEGYRPRWR